MTDKKDQAKIQSGKTSTEKKPSEEELQQWLDAVHFGSCCRDPLLANDDQEDNANGSINKKPDIKQK